MESLRDLRIVVRGLIRNRGFSAVAIITREGIGIVGGYVPSTLTGIPIPARLSGAMFDAQIFDSLGVQPLIGRTRRRADSDPGADALRTE
jgi:hypothetical protein